MRNGRRDRSVLAAAAIGALGVLLAFVSATAEAKPVRLEAGEVTALIAGNTVYGYNPRDDSNFTMFHSSNGQVRAELRNVTGQVSRSDGRWWVNDLGKLCVQWENFRWVNSCAIVTRDEEADSVTFIDDNGHIVSFGEVVTGNPDDI